MSSSNNFKMCYIIDVSELLSEGKDFSQASLENIKPKLTDQAKKFLENSIKQGSVISMVIDGKEGHYPIVHYDLNSEIGNIYVCDSKTYIEKGAVITSL